jgi:hypothetical protein
MAGRLRVYIQAEEDPLVATTRGAATRIARLHSQDTGRAGADSRRPTARYSAASSSLHSGVRGAVGSAAGAIAAYFSISQLSAAISATEDLAKSTRGLHENLGLSIKAASEWSAVAQVRGVDSTKLGQAFKTLSTQVVAARDGSDAATESFRKLGFTGDDVERGARDTGFLLSHVADGLKSIGAGADKASISGKLFGRGWSTVQPLLRDGAKALHHQLSLANKYGATFDGEALRSVNDLIGAQRELQLAQLGARVQFTENVAPHLIQFGLGVANLVNDARRGHFETGSLTSTLRDVWAVTKDLVSFNVATARIFAKIFPTAFGIVKDVAGFAIDLIGGSFRALRDGWNATKAVMRGAFALIKRAAALITAPIRFVLRLVGRIFGGVGRGVLKLGQFIGYAVRPIVGVIRDIARFMGKVMTGAISALGLAEESLPVVGVRLPKLKGPAADAHAAHVQRHQRGGIVKMAAGGNIVAVPGFPGERANSRIIPALLGFAKRYKLLLTDAYGPGHVSPEHTIYGTAADFVPGAGGSWGMVGQAAAAAVRAGWTPVGYDGSNGTEAWPGHGPGEHVHVVFLTVAEYLAGKSPGEAAGAVVQTIPKIHVTGQGALAGMAQGAADRVRRAANAYLAKAAPSASSMEGPSAGTLTEAEFLRFANEAIRVTGHNDFSAQGLLVLARQESGLQVDPAPPADINSAQGNPSRGLMQVTGTTFRAYHQSGTSSNIVDPVANIAASINYQVARYGGQITFSPYQEGGYVGTDPYVAPGASDGVMDRVLKDMEDQLRAELEIEREPAPQKDLALAIARLA